MINSYAVPMDAIRFAFRHIAFEEDTPSLEIDEALFTQILEQAGRFATERLIPINLPGDREGVSYLDGLVRTSPAFRDAYRDWASAGWLGVCAPESMGGSALPRAITAPLDEIWNAANMSFHICPTLTQAALKLILAHGSAEQRDAYLPQLISGRYTASMGLTESHAGSDLSTITTRATPLGDGTYHLRGAKIFTSFGEHDWSENILGLVLARIDGAPEGSKGTSLFIVPKYVEDGRLNDVLCTGVEHKLGLRAAPTCSMSYGSREGAIGHLLGAANAGLATMFVMMNKARLACALQGVGISERALQQAKSFAGERLQGRRNGRPAPIANHPDVRRMLFRMEALTLGARALTYTAVTAVEGGPDTEPSTRAGLLTPLAKVFASDVACEVASLNVQVHGGMGYIEETGAAQLLRDARAIPIYEGTNGIQAIDFVSRKVANDGAEGLRTELERVRHWTSQCASSMQLSAYAASLEAGIAPLYAATDWIVDPSRTSDERLAAATPFTNLAAVVLAGGYIAKGLLSAQQTDPMLFASTAHTAGDYGTMILSYASGLLAEVLGSGATVR